MKSKVFSGLVWKFAERISAQLVTFIVSIVLARILDPSHYGAIAIVNVFIALANVFVVSGFGNSLIQKKDSDDTDFSSVFYFNIVMSLVMYAVVFFAAPYIAKFYDMPILSPVLRVMGIRLIVAGVNSVQHAYVSRHMLFKRFFWSTLGGTIVSGVVGIIMAYKGFGIWALAAQYMVNTTVDTIVLFITVKWYPKLLFSLKRLGSLFSYGWKLLVSSLIDTGYSELRALVIGKTYTASELAYYHKGSSFPSLVVTNVNSSINSVLFPAMSQAQSSPDQIKAMVRRSIQISSYIMFPMMMGLSLVADDFVRLLLTEKWLPCVPFLRIMCIVYAFMPIHTANLQAIKAMGRSDLFLKMEIIKKIIGISLLFAFVGISVKAIALGSVAASVLSSFINAFPNKKMLGYSYTEQIRDLLPAILCSFGMAAIVCVVSYFMNLPTLISLILKCLVGVVAYIAVSKMFKVKSFSYILSVILGTKRKKNANNEK